MSLIITDREYEQFDALCRKTLADSLRKFIFSKGLTKGAIAKATGLRYETINNILSQGEVSQKSIYRIKLLINENNTNKEESK